MTVKECYKAMESDYEEIMKRLGTEERVKKYLNKFLDDESFQGTCEALEAGNYELAFRQVHNLKGVSLNLAFSRLHKSSDVLCEALRGGEHTEEVGNLFQVVKEDYERVIQAIRQL